MSLTGIASSALMNYQGESVQSNRQKWQQEFQQLGQDIQSGNLSAAQTDFTTLQQLSPQINATASTASSSSLAQAFSQLGTDLKAGNTTAAQQDYSSVQQQLVSRTARGHHHVHPGGGDLTQLVQQLGQALQAGNLSGAQQAYTTLQQQLQSLGEGQTGQSQSGNVTVSA